MDRTSAGCMIAMADGQSGNRRKKSDYSRPAKPMIHPKRFDPPRRDSYRDECRMTSQVTVRSLCFFLGFAGLATAQEPPPLEPPDLEPPRTSAPQPQAASTPRPTNPKPASPPTARPAATIPPPIVTPRQGPSQAAPVRTEAGPMLAIPGITAPTARPQPSMRLPAAAPPAVGISPFSSLLDDPPAFLGDSDQALCPIGRDPSARGAAGSIVARADPDDDRAAPR